MNANPLGSADRSLRTGAPDALIGDVVDCLCCTTSFIAYLVDGTQNMGKHEKREQATALWLVLTSLAMFYAPLVSL